MSPHTTLTPKIFKLNVHLGYMQVYSHHDILEGALVNKNDYQNKDRCVEQPSLLIVLLT